jgi:hypothetical protein
VDGRDAHAVVAHLDAHAGRAAPRAATSTVPPSGAWRSALAHQVADDALQQRRVGAHGQAAVAPAQPHARLDGAGGMLCIELVEQRGERHLGDGRREHLRVEPRDFQQVVEQHAHELGALLQPQHGRALRGRSRPAAGRR